jgi:antitoxin protein of toxin-antitoxin system
MAIGDRLKDLTDKAQSTAAEHKDEIRDAVGKAQVAADQRTGGKYHDQIAGAAAKAEAYLDKLAPEESTEQDPDAAEPKEKPAAGA